MRTIDIKVEGDYKYARMYLEFLRPLTKLTDKECEVVARILERRTELVYSEGLKEGRALYRELFSIPSRKRMRDLLGLSSASYQNTIYALRDKGFLVKQDDVLRLNPKLLVDPRREDGLMVRMVRTDGPV